MTRTPDQTKQALNHLYRRYEGDYWGPQPHVEATQEQSERLRRQVERMCALAAELEQLAIDLNEAGCHQMAWDLYSLHCDAVYYLDGPFGPDSEAPNRVAGILAGTYVSD